MIAVKNNEKNFTMYLINQQMKLINVDIIKILTLSPILDGSP